MKKASLYFGPWIMGLALLVLALTMLGQFTTATASRNSTDSTQVTAVFTGQPMPGGGISSAGYLLLEISGSAIFSSTPPAVIGLANGITSTLGGAWINNNGWRWIGYLEENVERVEFSCLDCNSWQINSPFWLPWQGNHLEQGILKTATTIEPDIIGQISGGGSGLKVGSLFQASFDPGDLSAYAGVAINNLIPYEVIRSVEGITDCLASGLLPASISEKLLIRAMVMRPGENLITLFIRPWSSAAIANTVGFVADPATLWKSFMPFMGGKGLAYGHAANK